MTLQFSMFLILLRWVFGVDRWDGAEKGFTEPTDWMCIIDESARVWQWSLQTQVLVSSMKKTWTKPLSNLISVKHEAQVHPRRQRRTDRQIQSTSLVEWPETRRWSMEENKFIPVKPSPFSKICHLWHWNRPFTQFVQIPVMWFLSTFSPSVWSLQVCKLVSEHSKTE